MIYTEKELALINQNRRAVPSKEYILDNGSLYVGQTDGSLKFITDNFNTKAQGAVGSILTNTSSSDSNYDPEVPEINTDVNQMNLGDVLAFAAAN